MKRIAEEIVSYLVVIFAMLGFLALMYVIAESTNIWKIFGVALFVIPAILFYEVMSIDEYYHKKGH